MLNRLGSRSLNLVRPILAAIFVALAANGFSQQVHFFLRNGDRLTGAVVAEDTTNVIITNGVVGRILIPASQILRREAVPPIAPTTNIVTAPLKPGPATNAAPVLSPAQRQKLDELVQLFMANQISPAEFQRRRETASAPPKPPAPKHWSGEVLAGIDLGVGSKDREFFSGRVRLNFTDKRLKNALDYQFTYGHTEGELAANRMDGTDKVDFELDSRYYLYALGGAGYDEVRKIDYYLQTGPGVGEHLIKRTNFVLNAEVGANYQLQNFEAGRDSYMFYFRFAQDSKWTITKKFSLEEKLEYTPQWNRVDEFKLRGEANLRYSLLDNLSLNLTVIDLYDTRVARGISRNDLQVRSSIGVKF